MLVSVLICLCHCVDSLSGVPNFQVHIVSICYANHIDCLRA
uniref:Uncharacterized protein n=1 Tax=Arundo donax TaxID=35708 RepID=A0A0A8ZV33_ARUDO